MRGDEQHWRDGEPDEPLSAVSSELLRTVAGSFPTGVAAITVVHDGRPYGFAANAFSSLSLEPPLVLVCAARTSRTRPVLVAAGSFTINILAADQGDVCSALARKGDDKFDALAWTPGPLGHPHLTGAAAHLDCALHSLLPGGDHVIVTGFVSAAAMDESVAPLVFWRGTLGPGPYAPPTA